MRLPALFSIACGFATLSAADPVAPPAVPHLVGHRALIRHAPEQTLAAFNAAIDLRVDLEIDVRRTRDGKLVCLHDDTVNRTTTGKGRVAEMSLREVQALDAGRKFDPAFAGERVPMLEELFALLRDRKAATLVAVDLKIDDEAVEEDVVKLAVKYRVLKQLVFIGRAIDVPEVRKKLRAANPAAAAAALAQTAADLDNAIVDADSSWVYCRFLPSLREAETAHAAGKRVFLAGPLFAGNEPENWAKAKAAGVDAILTDFPLECRAGWRAAGIVSPK